MFENIQLAAWMGIGGFGVPETVALAAVAAIGYLFGHRTRQEMLDPVSEQARRELKRAISIARELEQIAATIRKDLATHHGSVSEFKEKVSEFSREENANTWKELCDQAERILAPTLKLATQISHAYDQIRQQSSQLMTFTEARTDPLTGISNRRALDEQLDIMFAMMHRYDRSFSLCIFDIDHFKKLNDREGHLYGDEMLKRVAKLIDMTARETDLVARYGGEEFVIVMPQTGLVGANIFGDRLRQLIEEELSLTISGGVAEAVHGDTTQTLLSRADSALYSAKANGRNCLFQHTGTLIRPYRNDLPTKSLNDHNSTMVENELLQSPSLETVECAANSAVD